MQLYSKTGNKTGSALLILNHTIPTFIVISVYRINQSLSRFKQLDIMGPMDEMHS